MKTRWLLTRVGAWRVLAVSAAAAGSVESPVIQVFCGMCDASAVVALDANLFAVADDEDNLLRIYDRQRPGAPLWLKDFSRFLDVEAQWPEVDLEGAARVGQRVYWISSHGCSAEGEYRPNRHRFFATDIVLRDGFPELVPVGGPHRGLVGDLARDPRYARFQLSAAAQRAPKTSGALNIEGLGAAPDGTLLLGFRSPIPGSQALVVPLLNPSDVVQGQRPRFADPLLLDLGGLGVRSLAWVSGRYYLIAGSLTGKGRSRLFEWNGGTLPPREVRSVDFDRLNPEAIAAQSRDQASELLVISDDGTVRIGGRPCKRLRDPALKRFRAAWWSL